MRTTAIRSMRHWGHMTKVYGQVAFGISPMEQKAFKGWGKLLVNTFNRYIGDFWWMFTPPVLGGYLWYKWMNEENARWSRKNPKDFENDE